MNRTKRCFLSVNLSFSRLKLFSREQRELDALTSF